MSGGMPVRPPLRKERDRLMFEFRRRRRMLRMSQTQLAGIMGIARGTLSHWETGRQGLTIGSLLTWARELGMKIDVHAESEPE